MTISASIVVSFDVVRRIPALLVSISTTAVPKWNSQPCWTIALCNTFADSASASGSIVSANSTRVTLLPKAAYRVAISKPIIPAPTMVNRCGISGNSSARVESQIRASTGQFGRLTGVDPTAIMTWSKSIVSPSTDTLLGPVKRASP